MQHTDSVADALSPNALVISEATFAGCSGVVVCSFLNGQELNIHLL